MEFTPPETDFLTDSYSLENGGFRKWRGFGRTKNPPFSRFYCITVDCHFVEVLNLEMKERLELSKLILYMSLPQGAAKFEVIKFDNLTNFSPSSIQICN